MGVIDFSSHPEHVNPARPSSPRAPRARPSAPRPWLPPPPQQLYSGQKPWGTVHFSVEPGLPELVAHAQSIGWFARGWSVLSVAWVELVYTTDAWQTTRALRSTDVPCPVVNAWYYLPHVRAGDQVEFAVHVGLSCRAPEDSAGERAQSDLWLNDGGKNYRQRAK